MLTSKSINWLVSCAFILSSVLGLDPLSLSPPPFLCLEGRWAGPDSPVNKADASCFFFACSSEILGTASTLLACEKNKTKNTNTAYEVKLLYSTSNVKKW